MSAEGREPSILHGRDEPVQELLPLRAGPLTAMLDGVDLRYVKLGEVEFVRRIYAAVRDQNWNTIPGVASKREVDVRDDSFVVRFDVRHANDELDFTWRGTITGTADGRISFSLDGRAGRDFPYNRIGFCILHPWRETAGARFRGETPDGPVEGTFPLSIGRQDFVDGLYISLFPAVSRLEHDVADDSTAVFEFEGDLFECEDQRNWTDASFKTYCTPLVEGLPHLATAGLGIAQAVTVSARGRPREALSEEATRLTVGRATGARVPPIGLSLPDGARRLSERETELLRALAPAHLRLALHLNQPSWLEELARAGDSVRSLGAALELTLFLREQQAGQLARLGEALVGVDVAHVLVVLEGGRSATRDETTPPELVRLVRGQLGLAGVPVAGGTDMYFCEINRTRPQMEAMDGLFWSVNPQVHAFDDVSLVETPEAQGEQVRTALEVTGGKPVFVGPVTLKRRYNVNATVPEAEEAEALGELPDSVDPRQASLLGAAWTAASTKYLAEAGAAAVTYFETTGWSGALQGDGEPPLPERFPARAGQVFPLYHVLANVAGWHGREVLSCESNEPLGVVGLAVRDDEGTHILVANLTPRVQEATVAGLAGPATLRRLNAASSEQALFEPGRFRAAGEPVSDGDGLRLALEPYETVRIDALRGEGNRMETKPSAEEALKGILGRPLVISQIAVVCHDLQKTMETYTKLLGWGPWNVYRHQAPRLHDTELHGKPAEYTMLGAETHVGEMGFELLQPLEGNSIYREWLERHGEGLHHVAVMLHDFEESTELRRRFAEQGMDVLMGGRIGETIEFYYLDTEPQLKIILESGSGHAIDLVPDYVYP